MALKNAADIEDDDMVSEYKSVGFYEEIASKSIDVSRLFLLAS